MSFVFLIAIVNLVAGFAFAVMLERRIVIPVPRWRWSRVESAEQSATQESPEPSPPRPLEEPEPAEPAVSAVPAQPEVVVAPERASDLEVIPEAWVEALRAANVEAESFVEATMYVLRLEVGPFLENLVESDRILRSSPTHPVEAIQALQKSARNWLTQVEEAAEQLQANECELQAHADMAERLLFTLREQNPAVRHWVERLAGLEASDPAAPAKCLDALQPLAELGHGLRDSIQQSLILVLRDEQRLDGFHRRYQFDPLTRLHNRAGLEVLFRNWWREDTARTRMVSAGLIVLDQMGKLNREYGLYTCDRFLAAAAELIQSLCTRESGLERVCRFTGSSFALFFGDTGPRNALAVVERIRQTMGVTTFEYRGEEMPVTVSCAVTEATAEDTTDSLFARLEQLVGMAKEGGRNCTRLDEGHGVETVVPPEFQVKARVIRVE